MVDADGREGDGGAEAEEDTARSDGEEGEKPDEKGDTGKRSEERELPRGGGQGNEAGEMPARLAALFKPEERQGWEVDHLINLLRTTLLIEDTGLLLRHRTSGGDNMMTSQQAPSHRATGPASRPISRGYEASSSIIPRVFEFPSQDACVDATVVQVALLEHQRRGEWGPFPSAFSLHRSVLTAGFSTHSAPSRSPGPSCSRQSTLRQTHPVSAPPACAAASLSSLPASCTFPTSSTPGSSSLTSFPRFSPDVAARDACISEASASLSPSSLCASASSCPRSFPSSSGFSAPSLRSVSSVYSSAIPATVSPFSLSTSRALGCLPTVSVHSWNGVNLFLKTPAWQRLYERIGSRLMMHLLTFTCLFVDSRLFSLGAAPSRTWPALAFRSPSCLSPLSSRAASRRPSPGASDASLDSERGDSKTAEKGGTRAKSDEREGDDDECDRELRRQTSDDSTDTRGRQTREKRWGRLREEKTTRNGENQLGKKKHKSRLIACDPNGEDETVKKEAKGRKRCRGRSRGERRKKKLQCQQAETCATDSRPPALSRTDGSSHPSVCLPCGASTSHSLISSSSSPACSFPSLPLDASCPPSLASCSTAGAASRLSHTPQSASRFHTEATHGESLEAEERRARQASTPHEARAETGRVEASLSLDLSSVNRGHQPPVKQVKEELPRGEGTKANAAFKEKTGAQKGKANPSRSLYIQISGQPLTQARLCELRHIHCLASRAAARQRVRNRNAKQARQRGGDGSESEATGTVDREVGVPGAGRHEDEKKKAATGAVGEAEEEGEDRQRREGDDAQTDTRAGQEETPGHRGRGNGGRHATSPESGEVNLETETRWHRVSENSREEATSRSFSPPSPRPAATVPGEAEREKEMDGCKSRRDRRRLMALLRRRRRLVTREAKRRSHLHRRLRSSGASPSFARFSDKREASPVFLSTQSSRQSGVRPSILRLPRQLICHHSSFNKEGGLPNYALMSTLALRSTQRAAKVRKKGEAKHAETTADGGRSGEPNRVSSPTRRKGRGEKLLKEATSQREDKEDVKEKDRGGDEWGEGGIEARILTKFVLFSPLLFSPLTSAFGRRRGAAKVARAIGERTQETREVLGALRRRLRQMRTNVQQGIERETQTETEALSAQPQVAHGNEERSDEEQRNRTWNLQREAKEAENEEKNEAEMEKKMLKHVRQRLTKSVAFKSALSRWLLKGFKELLARYRRCNFLRLLRRHCPAKRPRRGCSYLSCRGDCSLSSRGSRSSSPASLPNNVRFASSRGPRASAPSLDASGCAPSPSLSSPPPSAPSSPSSPLPSFPSSPASLSSSRCERLAVLRLETPPDRVIAFLLAALRRIVPPQLLVAGANCACAEWGAESQGEWTECRGDEKGAAESPESRGDVGDRAGKGDDRSDSEKPREEGKGERPWKMSARSEKGKNAANHERRGVKARGEHDLKEGRERAVKEKAGGRLQEVFLSRIVFFLFTQLVIPLLRQHFYVTEAEPSAHRMRFFRKIAWLAVEQQAALSLHRSCFALDSHGDAEERRGVRGLAENAGVSSAPASAERSVLKPGACLSKRQGRSRRAENQRPEGGPKETEETAKKGTRSLEKAEKHGGLRRTRLSWGSPDGSREDQGVREEDKEERGERDRAKRRREEVSAREAERQSKRWRHERREETEAVFEGTERRANPEEVEGGRGGDGGAWARTGRQSDQDEEDENDDWLAQEIEDYVNPEILTRVQEISSVPIVRFLPKVRGCRPLVNLSQPHSGVLLAHLLSAALERMEKKAKEDRERRQAARQRWLKVLRDAGAFSLLFGDTWAGAGGSGDAAGNLLKAAKTGRGQTEDRRPEAGEHGGQQGGEDSEREGKELRKRVVQMVVRNLLRAANREKGSGLIGSIGKGGIEDEKQLLAHLPGIASSFLFHACPSPLPPPFPSQSLTSPIRSSLAALCRFHPSVLGCSVLSFSDVHRRLLAWWSFYLRSFKKVEQLVARFGPRARVRRVSFSQIFFVVGDLQACYEGLTHAELLRSVQRALARANVQKMHVLKLYKRVVSPPVPERARGRGGGAASRDRRQRRQGRGAHEEIAETRRPGRTRERSRGSEDDGNEANLHTGDARWVGREESGRGRGRETSGDREERETETRGSGGREKDEAREKESSSRVSAPDAAAVFRRRLLRGSSSGGVVLLSDSNQRLMLDSRELLLSVRLLLRHHRIRFCQRRQPFHSPTHHPGFPPVQGERQGAALEAAADPPGDKRKRGSDPPSQPAFGTQEEAAKRSGEQSSRETDGEPESARQRLSLGRKDGRSRLASPAASQRPGDEASGEGRDKAGTNLRAKDWHQAGDGQPGVGSEGRAWSTEGVGGGQKKECPGRERDRNEEANGVYRQTIGIPQGSNISGLLCALFYADRDARPEVQALLRGEDTSHRARPLQLFARARDVETDAGEALHARGRSAKKSGEEDRETNRVGVVEDAKRFGSEEKKSGRETEERDKREGGDRKDAERRVVFFRHVGPLILEVARKTRGEDLRTHNTSSGLPVSSDSSPSCPSSTSSSSPAACASGSLSSCSPSHSPPSSSLSLSSSPSPHSASSSSSSPSSPSSRASFCRLRRSEREALHALERELSRLVWPPLLMRWVDDFLFLSPSRAAAEAFLSLLLEQHVWGKNVNRQKLKTDLFDGSWSSTAAVFQKRSGERSQAEADAPGTPSAASSAASAGTQSERDAVSEVAVRCEGEAQESVTRLRSGWWKKETHWGAAQNFGRINEEMKPETEFSGVVGDHTKSLGRSDAGDMTVGRRKRTRPEEGSTTVVKMPEARKKSKRDTSSVGRKAKTPSHSPTYSSLQIYPPSSSLSFTSTLSSSRSSLSFPSPSSSLSPSSHSFSLSSSSLPSSSSSCASASAPSGSGPCWAGVRFSFDVQRRGFCVLPLLRRDVAPGAETSGSLSEARERGRRAKKETLGDTSVQSSIRDSLALQRGKRAFLARGATANGAEFMAEMLEQRLLGHLAMRLGTTRVFVDLRLNSPEAACRNVYVVVKTAFLKLRCGLERIAKEFAGFLRPAYILDLCMRLIDAVLSYTRQPIPFQWRSSPTVPFSKGMFPSSRSVCASPSSSSSSPSASPPVLESRGQHRGLSSWAFQQRLRFVCFNAAASVFRGFQSSKRPRTVTQACGRQGTRYSQNREEKPHSSFKATNTRMHLHALCSHCAEISATTSAPCLPILSSRPPSVERLAASVSSCRPPSVPSASACPAPSPQKSPHSASSPLSSDSQSLPFSASGDPGRPLLSAAAVAHAAAVPVQKSHPQKAPFREEEKNKCAHAVSGPTVEEDAMKDKVNDEEGVCLSFDSRLIATVVLSDIQALSSRSCKPQIAMDLHASLPASRGSPVSNPVRGWEEARDDESGRKQEDSFSNAMGEEREARRDSDEKESALCNARLVDATQMQRVERKGRPAERDPGSETGGTDEEGCEAPRRRDETESERGTGKEGQERRDGSASDDEQDRGEGEVGKSREGRGKKAEVEQEDGREPKQAERRRSGEARSFNRRQSHEGLLSHRGATFTDEEEESFKRCYMRCGHVSEISQSSETSPGDARCAEGERGFQKNREKGKGLPFPLRSLFFQGKTKGQKAAEQKKQSFSACFAFFASKAKLAEVALELRRQGRAGREPLRQHMQPGIVKKHVREAKRRKTEERRNEKMEENTDKKMHKMKKKSQEEETETTSKEKTEKNVEQGTKKMQDTTAQEEETEERNTGKRKEAVHNFEAEAGRQSHIWTPCETAAKRRVSDENPRGTEMEVAAVDEENRDYSGSSLPSQETTLGLMDQKKRHKNGKVVDAKPPQRGAGNATDSGDARHVRKTREDLAVRFSGSSRDACRMPWRRQSAENFACTQKRGRNSEQKLQDVGVSERAALRGQEKEQEERGKDEDERGRKENPEKEDDAKEDGEKVDGNEPCPVETKPVLVSPEALHATCRSSASLCTSFLTKEDGLSPVFACEGGRSFSSRSATEKALLEEAVKAYLCAQRVEKEEGDRGRGWPPVMRVASRKSAKRRRSKSTAAKMTSRD
ncbi:UNVERIFIED_CONTAM: RNA-directed DNA polymerase [Hammondia hammondi]|eukprot:XP_008886981.1 RNA-directed DNA polymerase [Hammondia hammondi]